MNCEQIEKLTDRELIDEVRHLRRQGRLTVGDAMYIAGGLGVKIDDSDDWRPLRDCERSVLRAVVGWYRLYETKCGRREA